MHTETMCGNESPAYFWLGSRRGLKGALHRPNHPKSKTSMPHPRCGPLLANSRTCVRYINSFEQLHQVEDGHAAWVHTRYGKGRITGCTHMGCIGPCTIMADAQVARPRQCIPKAHVLGAFARYMTSCVAGYGDSTLTMFARGQVIGMTSSTCKIRNL